MAQYASTAERARVLDRYPDYAVDIVPAAGRFVASADDITLAASDNAIEVQESFHASVIYFPAEDVDFALLERSEHSTRCPFKGDASYYSVVTDGVRLDNAVWVYEEAMAEVADLAGYVAFYTDRIRVAREG